MVCQKCGTREATVLIQTVVQNKVSSAALCSTCAGAFAPADPLDAFLELLAGPSRAKAHPSRCPACRAAYSDFKQTGRFGCPECYEAFRSQVRDFLPRVHGGAYQHRGKTPGRR